MQRHSCVCCAAFALTALAWPAAGQHYQQVNLISDLPNPPGGAAQVVDPNLVNPWGVAASPTGPFWVANQKTGTATVYNVNPTTEAVTKSSLVVPIPGGITGQVFNGSNRFMVSAGSASAPATFLFSALNGTISGWAAKVGAETRAGGARPAVYTGLAIATRGGTPFLYAANPAGGRIDVFDGNLAPVRLAGLLPFGDPDLPKGDVPFNIVNLWGLLYVTYEGPVGVVNVFNPDGAMLKRFATGGALQNPWGIAQAPGAFGRFSRAILVGNFNHSTTAPNGPGTISAFDARSGAFLGTLDDGAGNPIAIDGLWALMFGNGGSGGSPDVLYFSAGIDGEAHGLFGAIQWQTAAAGATTGSVTAADWPMMGRDLSNSRSQPAETKIGVANVKQLTPKWTFTTGGDVSATPTVSGNAVYFPDWGGNLFAVRRDTGAMIWSHKISDYNHVPGSIARVSPAVAGGDIIVGDTQSGAALHDGTYLIAIDQATGNLHWMTHVDTQPQAVITGSPVVFGNMVFVGISSNEELLARDDSYACCTFRGSMVALDATTGAILWRTYVMPDNGGRTDQYSGGAIWQPPAIDPGRNLLYFGTGNNYTVPASVLACAAANPLEDCTAADDYFHTAMALDVTTGRIVWWRKVGTVDAWTVACTSQPAGHNCPSPAGPDFDLGGSGPNLLPNLVGFGQKSGLYWALNPDTGVVLWATFLGPGSTLGGIEWGSATDGTRIYAAIDNSKHIAYTLAGGQPATAGSWAAVDVATGKILWQMADPDGAPDPASVTVANGVLYAASYSGKVFGLDAATGAMLWSFSSGGSVLDGPAVADGVVYWGSGYKHIPPGVGNNKVFAFGLP